MYPEIELVKFLKNTERNDKEFGEMDIINKNDDYPCIYGRIVNFKMIYYIKNYKRVKKFLKIIYRVGNYKRV